MQIQCPKCKQWFEDEDENGKCELCGAALNPNDSNHIEQANSEAELYLKQQKEGRLKNFWRTYYIGLPIVIILLILITINSESENIKGICLMSALLIFMTWHATILIRGRAFDPIVKKIKKKR